MGESAVHKHFIDIIYKYSIKIIPENHSRLVLVDGYDNLLFKEIPPIINGFRPDLFYEFNSLLIIGEAKTKNDYSTKHSLNQYREYIKYCNNFCGDCYIILCCPWMCIPELKIIIRKIKSNYSKDIKIIFLDEISGDLECKK